VQQLDRVGGAGMRDDQVAAPAVFGPSVVPELAEILLLLLPLGEWALKTAPGLSPDGGTLTCVLAGPGGREVRATARAEDYPAWLRANDTKADPSCDYHDLACGLWALVQELVVRQDDPPAEVAVVAAGFWPPE